MKQDNEARLAALAAGAKRLADELDESLVDDIRALGDDFGGLGAHDREVRLLDLERRLATELAAEPQPPVDTGEPATALVEAQDEVSGGVAPVTPVRDHILRHREGRITVLGGLGQGVAGHLARMQQPAARYRFIFPSSRSYHDATSIAMKQIRIQREGELKVLMEWRKALERTAAALVPEIETYVSRRVTDTTTLLLETSDGSPTLIAWWSESLTSGIESVGGVGIATFLTSESGHFEGVLRHIGDVVENANPYHQHEVVAKVAAVDTVEDVKRPDGFAEATAKLFSRFDSNQREFEKREGDQEGLPVALVLAHRQDGNRNILLQRRDPRNARDAYGSHSLVSSRLHAQDLIEALNECDPPSPIQLRDGRNEYPADPSEATSIMYDRMVASFSQLPRGMAKFPIPLSAFRRAARRECYSSLGLQVDDQRLTHHPLGINESVVDGRYPPVYVELFSLRLTHDELRTIPTNRPFAKTEVVRWPDEFDAIDLDDLNSFLQKARREGFLRSLVDRITRISSGE